MSVNRIARVRIEINRYNKVTKATHVRIRWKVISRDKIYKGALKRHQRGMSENSQECSNNHQDSIMLSLLQRSVKAKEHSHSPYSKFRVGAALLTDTGEIIDGCNVENASYGLSICAERTALVKAVSMGFKKFLAVAVSTDMEEFIAPCGACRQFISEFGSSCDVYLVKPDLSYKKISISELLPLAFTSSELERASRTK